MEKRKRLIIIGLIITIVIIMFIGLFVMIQHPKSIDSGIDEPASIMAMRMNNLQLELLHRQNSENYGSFSFAIPRHNKRNDAIVCHWEAGSYKVLANDDYYNFPAAGYGAQVQPNSNVLAAGYAVVAVNSELGHSSITADEDETQYCIFLYKKSERKLHRKLFG